MSVCSASTCDLERECACGAERLCRECIHSRCRGGETCPPGCYCRGTKLCRQGLHDLISGLRRVRWLDRQPAKESVSSLSTDLTELNNDQLSQQLRSHGISVGPIVGSTRRLYEKKLAKLLGREGAATQRSTTTSYNTRTVTVTNGAGGGEDEYSDSEPEEAPVRLSQVAATARGGGGGGGGGGELRQRHAPDDNAYGYSYYKTSRVADAAQLNPRSPALRPVFLRSEDDQPTPRRGVRDVRGSYPREQYLLTKTAVDSYASGRAPVGGGGAWDLDSKADSAGWLRPLVKLCVLLLLIAVAYLGYQNYDDAPSFQSLQDAARDAVHKASEKVSSLRQKTDA